jgi:orotidine-5'-phosphate decarboxylase
MIGFRGGAWDMTASTVATAEQQKPAGPGFVERWRQSVTRFGPFCLGVDPSGDVLRRWGLPDSADGLAAFCDRVLPWTDGIVGTFKPQMAFFERFGAKGFATLERLVAALRSRGSLVLLDGKRGDIGTTCAAYADAYFGAASSCRADAITAHAYLGFAALEPLFAAADRAGGAVFTVVASSNPEGQGLQAAATAGGASVALSLAEAIRARNGASGTGSCAAVVGATRGDAARDVLEALGGALVLAPGIGAQGATIADLARFANRRDIIPSASRAVLDAGHDAAAFRRQLEQFAAEAMALTR